jgi:hypothetical protein
MNNSNNALEYQPIKSLALLSTTSPDGLINISYEVSYYYVNLLPKHGALFRQHENL